jgi:phenylalanyl-tRNA synthetase alpha subunit
MAIEKQVAEIEADAAKAIASAADEAALEAIRVAELGKKGRVSLLMRELGGMSPEQRQVAGPALNGLKDRLTTSISARKAELELAALNVRLEAEREDLTLPPRFEPVGALHPVMQVFEELAAIFADMGFAVAEGPDIEDDFHNFTALNFPPGHPAREMHDTFFMKPAADGEAARCCARIPRPVQVRTMLAKKPPIRMIVPGAYLPQRLGRDPHADVPPDRRSGHRRQGPHGPPEGVPHRSVLKALLRSVDNDDVALPPALLSVHRAERGDGYPLRPLGRGDQDRRRQ